MCVADENGIVFEAEVSRDEALTTLELYKQTSPGLSSVNSLQGVLLAMDGSRVRPYTHTHTHTHYTHSRLCWLLAEFLCFQHLSLVYLGRRSRTKSYLSMKMYEEEIQVRVGQGHHDAMCLITGHSWLLLCLCVVRTASEVVSLCVCVGVVC